MRSAGIRYISGMRRLQLFGHSLKDDSIELLLGCIGASIMGAVLIYCFQLTPFSYSIVIFSSIILQWGFLLNFCLVFLILPSLHIVFKDSFSPPFKREGSIEAHIGFPLYLSISRCGTNWPCSSSNQYLWISLANLPRGK